jgi:aminopeptidase N
MVTHWDWITKQFKNSHDYADFPKYSSSAFSTREELAQYKQFFEPKLNEADIAMTIKQGIEEIETRVLWRERDLAAVTDYLKKYTHA